MFEEKPVEPGSIEDFLTPEVAFSVPKLSENQKDKKEGPISLDELTTYLNITKIMSPQVHLGLRMSSLYFFG